MNTTKRELDAIELQLDILRATRCKRFTTSMTSVLLSAGTIASESIEGSAMALCLYFSMAVATVSSQISMSQLKERRETLTRIFIAKKVKATRGTNVQ